VDQQKNGWTSRLAFARDRYPSAAAGCTRRWCASGDPSAPVTENSWLR